MRSIIIMLIVLMCSMVVTPKKTFAGNPFEYTDVIVAPMYNAGLLGDFGGFMGGSGDWAVVPTAMDWSIGNTVPFSLIRTEDMVFSTCIGDWRNPLDWKERMRITKDGSLIVDTDTFVVDSTHDMVELGTANFIVDTDTLYVDSTNHNVGIGTASPDDKLHLYGSGSIVRQKIRTTNPSGSTNLRFEGGGGYGTAEIWYDDSVDAFTVKAIPSGSILRLLGRNNAGIVVDQNGNVGIGTASPTNILEVAAASGTGYVDSSGNFVDGSSREYKDEIRDLDLQTAQEALDKLDPVRYFGKNSHDDEHLGFIAEDVPALVAQTGRKGLRAMDIVAVLTKVVQEQQQNMEVLKARIESLEKE